MKSERRVIYVISDLHIGGAYADDRSDPNARGFRICTRVDALAQFVRDVAARAQTTGVPAELVINGDFVDFLAEDLGTDERWSPFIEDPDVAADRLGIMIERDRVLFDALAELLAGGQRLTILLGNHDVELSLPAVRRRLEGAVGADGAEGRLTFLYDGEAYVVGDAIIEHGNRYDGFNVIDHDGLRRVRSFQSRREPVKPKQGFRTAFGSRIVAEVMNAVKSRYRFVDLLKPESTAAIPLLLALAPEARKNIARFAELAIQAKRHAPGKDSQPRFAGDISASPAEADFGSGGAFGGDMGFGGGGDMGAGSWSPPDPDDDLLRELLGDTLGADIDGFLDELKSTSGESSGGGFDTSGDISAGFGEVVAKARLLLSPNTGPLHRRMKMLRAAMEGIRRDRSYDRSVETATEYQKAAEHLADRGFRWVVFGHTHLAKQVALEGGSTYLNSGTWADLMRFPTHILDLPREQSLAELTAFCEALDENRIAQWLAFMPTFARLEVGADGSVTRGEVRDYRGADSV